MGRVCLFLPEETFKVSSGDSVSKERFHLVPVHEGGDNRLRDETVFWTGHSLAVWSHFLLGLNQVANHVP